MEEQGEKFGKRLSRATIIEYKKFWSGYRLLVTLSGGLVAPLLVQLERGIHSMLGLWDVLESGALGVCLSLGSTYLYSRRKGAESLDAGWQKRIKLEEEKSKQLQEALAAEKELAERLGAEVAELKKPKRSPAAERNYQASKALLDTYGDDDKTVLRHLQKVGKMTDREFFPLTPLPTGFSRDRATAVLGRLVADNVVTREAHQIANSFELTWQIAPGVISYLDELL